MKKFFLSLTSLLLTLSLLTGCASLTMDWLPGDTDMDTDAAAQSNQTESTGPRVWLAQSELSGHPALMTADGDNLFYPDDAATRTDFAAVLYALYGGPFTMHHTAQHTAAELSFFPDQAITADEASAVLFDLSDGRPGSLWGSLRTAGEACSAMGGTLTRAQLAYIAELLAGRDPDEAECTALLCGGYLPADVHAGDTYAYYIADALTDALPDTPEDGVHRADGSLYCTRNGGELVRDLDIGVWTFGLDGRYTTGDEELDGYLEGILEASGANALDDEDALEAVYLYIKYNYEYIVTPADMETIDTGVTGWEYERALRFFQYGGGTCYGFAAAFGLAARMLGQTAYIVAATINQYDGPHGFVVIPENDIDWIYDVELETTRQERHADLELFHIQNHTIYHYWYDPDW